MIGQKTALQGTHRTHTKWLYLSAKQALIIRREASFLYRHGREILGFFDYDQRPSGLEGFPALGNSPNGTLRGLLFSTVSRDLPNNVKRCTLILKIHPWIGATLQSQRTARPEARPTNHKSPFTSHPSLPSFYKNRSRSRRDSKRRGFRVVVRLSYNRICD
jgi:hypothetical protein